MSALTLLYLLIVGLDRYWHHIHEGKEKIVQVWLTVCLAVKMSVVRAARLSNAALNFLLMVCS